MRKVNSEAIFGSVGRGDQDSMSDRDILIVDDDVHVLNHRRLELQSEGWSVASYTFAKLNALSQKGALFIQHLKSEAVFINDSGGRLRKDLDSFQSKMSYEFELAENSQLASLVTTRPRTYFGDLWAADVLYVTVRNYGIFFLAERKKYVFKYSGVIHELCDCGVISRHAIDLLLSLRSLKCAYRNKQLHSEAAEILNESLMRLPAQRFPYRSKAISPTSVIKSTMELAPNCSTYHRLRNLEKAHVALSGLVLSEDVHDNLKLLTGWIENPRAYAFFAKSAESELLKLMQTAVNSPSAHESYVNPLFKIHGPSARKLQLPY